MSAGLRIEAREGFEVWQLDRPARRNALGLGLLRELAEARAAAVARGVSTVVLGAVGSVFCAGFDLGDLQAIEVSAGELLSSPLHELFDQFSPPQMTLITAIQGPAVGGGVELALLGDVRIAAPAATFLLPPARHGIVYPARGMVRLRTALGASLLGAMLATAEAVEARRLHAAGVLWALEDDPLDAACRLAARVATLPAGARLANARALSGESGEGGP